MDLSLMYRARANPIEAVQRPDPADEKATAAFVVWVLATREDIAVLKPVGGTTAMAVVKLNIRVPRLDRESMFDSILFEIEPGDWVIFDQQAGEARLGRMSNSEFNYYFKKVSEADVVDARRSAPNEPLMV